MKTLLKHIDIIIADISTLDEARYFSAMGADWLGFNASALSADEMKTIAEWVVGPKFFVEVVEGQEELLFEISNKLQLHGVCIPVAASIPAFHEGLIIRVVELPVQEIDLMHLNETSLLIKVSSTEVVTHALDLLGDVCLRNTCWIEYDIHQDDAFTLFNQLACDGIVIRAGESKTQTDDFSIYDMFFEKLGTLRDETSHGN